MLTLSNVATIEFKFRAIVLIEKFVLDVVYEKIGVAGSHFCAHGHTLDLFIITQCQRMKNSLVLTQFSQAEQCFQAWFLNCA